MLSLRQSSSSVTVCCLSCQELCWCSVSAHHLILSQCAVSPVKSCDGAQSPPIISFCHSVLSVLSRAVLVLSLRITSSSVTVCCLSCQELCWCSVSAHHPLLSQCAVCPVKSCVGAQSPPIISFCHSVLSVLSRAVLVRSLRQSSSSVTVCCLSCQELCWCSVSAHHLILSQCAVCPVKSCDGAQSPPIILFCHSVLSVLSRAVMVLSHRQSSSSVTVCCLSCQELCWCSVSAHHLILSHCAVCPVKSCDGAQSPPIILFCHSVLSVLSRAVLVLSLRPSSSSVTMCCLSCQELCWCSVSAIILFCHSVLSVLSRAVLVLSLRPSSHSVTLCCLSCQELCWCSVSANHPLLSQCAVCPIKSCVGAQSPPIILFCHSVLSVLQEL